MKKLPKKISKKTLLALPKRDWNGHGVYEALFIFPSGKKHESGFSCMTIVGIKNGLGEVVAEYCDDIEWQVTGSYPYSFRNDCEWPSGIIHPWGATFIIGSTGSSTTIKVSKAP